MLDLLSDYLFKLGVLFGATSLLLLVAGMYLVYRRFRCIPKRLSGAPYQFGSHFRGPAQLVILGGSGIVVMSHEKIHELVDAFIAYFPEIEPSHFERIIAQLLVLIIAELVIIVSSLLVPISLARVANNQEVLQKKAC